MDFVNRLRPEHLDAFWYFASAANVALIGTFGALLMATSPGREEADFYACRLHEFKWTLRVSAEKAAWVRSALETMEANLEMLRGLPEKEGASAVAVSMTLPAADTQLQSAQTDGHVGAYDERKQISDLVQNGHAFGVNGDGMEIEGWSSQFVN